MELLRKRGVEFDVIEYLKNPPTREALEKILAMLEGPPADLVRKDKRFGELGLKADDYTEPKKIVALLLQHPELMQRPINKRFAGADCAPTGEAGSAVVKYLRC